MKRAFLLAGGIVALALFLFILAPQGYLTAFLPSPPSDLNAITLPPGFSIAIYAEDVPGARSMALGPKGTLFVGTRTTGRVYAVQDDDGDFIADRTITIAEGLNMPNGVAIKDGDLFVAEVNRILRFDGIEDRLDDPPNPIVVSDIYPTDTHHGWKFIRFGPDGKLYVPVGAPCNICDPGDPYASITRMDPDGTGFEIAARGVRNTVGFDWHPKTGELWFTDNGRDWFGDDIPPDELNYVSEEGMHFGFPYCHGSDLQDDAFTGRSCDEFVPPAQELSPHIAALGMRFSTGDMFPPEYANQIFIAEHGSWNRKVPIGYRITLVRLDGGTPASYEVFAQGWLRKDGTAWGRPVDIQVMPDGSLLVSDDKAGTIYRIAYEGNGEG